MAENYLCQYYWKLFPELSAVFTPFQNGKYLRNIDNLLSANPEFATQDLRMIVQKKISGNLFAFRKKSSALLTISACPELQTQDSLSAFFSSNLLPQLALFV